MAVFRAERVGFSGWGEEFLAVYNGWAAGALTERLLLTEHTALFVDVLVLAGFVGRYTEGDFHRKVVALGEGLTTGTVED
eukprot:4125086-Ditylum_brightwellii.AAC.1